MIVKALTPSESGEHVYQLRLKEFLALVLLGFVLLCVLASATAPALPNPACRSTPANRAVVLCAVHENHS